jgi:hypothetical protein
MSSKKALKIFLCHSSADKPEVKQLHDLLLKHGAAPWLDAEQLLPGQDWDFEIKKALDVSDVILICLSRNSVDKEGYVQREVRIALDRALEMPEGRIFLIPVRLEECELPSRLSSYQYMDLFAENGIEKLIKSLNVRAKQVKAAQLSTDHDQVSNIRKPATEKRSKTRKPSTNTTINIHGNVNGGNIVVGDNNEVTNK